MKIFLKIFSGVLFLYNFDFAIYFGIVANSPYYSW